MPLNWEAQRGHVRPRLLQFTEDIKKAFDPFYTSTSLTKATDVNVLHDPKDAMDDVVSMNG